jgi:iron complex outermembrane receptor protein
LVSNGLAGVDAAFINIGGATYQGVEAQMAYVVGGGFSAYVNGSINDAKSTTTGLQISAAPDVTAALGGLYGSGPWAGSLIYKYVGAVRQKDFDPTKTTPIAGQSYYDYYQTAGYGTVDLGVAYTIKNAGSFGKAVKLQLNVFNLMDSQAVTAISTGKTVPFDTYVYQPARSFQLSLKADF